MKIKPEAWLILFVLTFIWGSSFILMKKGLESFSPEQVACLRITFAGLVLLPVAIRNLSGVSRRAIFYSALFGLNAGLPNFLFTIAETRVSSSTAGILNGLTPIFTLIFGVAFFRVPFNIFKLTGVIVGFGGAAMLVFFNDGFGKPAHFTDSQIGLSLLIVLATCLYGIAGNIMKKHLDDVPGPVISAISYGIFTIPCAGYLFYSDFASRMQAAPSAIGSLGYVAILGILGSAVAVTLLSTLIKQSNALFGSFVTYLIPFVAILWGALAGEHIGWVPYLSLGVILAAIYISGFKPSHFNAVKRLWPVGTDNTVS